MFRKKKKNKKPSKLSRLIVIYFWKYLKTKNIREKVIKLNFWAEKNKRKMFYFSISFLFALFVLNGIITAFSFNEDNANNESVMNQIEDVNSVIQGFKQIENTKYNNKEQYSNLIYKGKQIKCELDSLLALKTKTHNDSILIISKYKQLNIIAKTLKNKDV